MQERKDNTKKVLKITGVIGILIFNLLCFLLLIKIVVEQGNELPSIVYISLIIFTILSDCILIYVLHKALKIIEEKEISKNLVNSKLLSDKYVEVMPISVPSRYYTFIKSELPALAKFFAILDKEGNGVRIEIKFNDHEEYHFFEYVCAENFLSSYKIKE